MTSGSPVGPPADDPAVTQAVIANYEEATAKIRETAKWFATAGAALGALLIGTSPLAGLGDLDTADLFVPILFGAIALGGLCWLVLATSNVLTPKVVELDRVVNDVEYLFFREQVRQAPADYFGAWARTVRAFAERRGTLYRSQARIRDRLEDISTSPPDRQALAQARSIVNLNLQRSAWITERLLAAADHAVTWERFRSARRQAAMAIVLVVLGVTGFLSAVGTAKSVAADAAFSGPLPVRVSLTDAGRTAWGSLLGEGCPTTDFEALLTEGGQSAPWLLMVTDDACTTGVLELTAAQGAVLVRSANG